VVCARSELFIDKPVGQRGWEKKKKKKKEEEKRKTRSIDISL
jgi:hypothetical protein